MSGNISFVVFGDAFISMCVVVCVAGQCPLIMYGVICGGQTHNRGYANTYSYLCFIPHLCTFHQSICRSSTRYGYLYMCNSMASFYMCMYTCVIYIYIDVCI